jgi:hypothetical protein
MCDSIFQSSSIIPRDHEKTRSAEPMVARKDHHPTGANVDGGLAERDIVVCS